MGIDVGLQVIAVGIDVDTYRPAKVFEHDFERRIGIVSSVADLLAFTGSSYVCSFARLAKEHWGRARARCPRSSSLSRSRSIESVASSSRAAHIIDFRCAQSNEQIMCITCACIRSSAYDIKNIGKNKFYNYASLNQETSEPQVSERTGSIPHNACVLNLESISMESRDSRDCVRAMNFGASRAMMRAMMHFGVSRAMLQCVCALGTNTMRLYIHTNKLRCVPAP
jgi:hypothetical protein